MYLCRGSAPAWLDTRTVLELFGNDSRSFDRFVLSDDGQRLVPDTHGSGSSPLHRVDRVVAAVLDLDEAEVRTSRRGRHNVGRLIAITAAVRIVADPAVVADHYGLGGPGSVRTALHRARGELAGRPSLQRQFDEITFQLGSDPG